MSWIRIGLMLAAAASRSRCPAPARRTLRRCRTWTRVQDPKGEGDPPQPRPARAFEEELLFPAGTQVAVFVPMDVGKMFARLGQVKLDDKVVANYLYIAARRSRPCTAAACSACTSATCAPAARARRLFTGRPARARDLRGATLGDRQGHGPQYVEFAHRRPSQAKLQPEFDVIGPAVGNHTVLRASPLRPFRCVGLPARFALAAAAGTGGRRAGRAATRSGRTCTTGDTSCSSSTRTATSTRARRLMVP